MINRLCTKDELQLIAAMSEDFAAEGCCNGINPETVEELAAYELYVAEEEGKLLGYAYGTAETASRKRFFILPGHKNYYVEIIYVKPEYRSRGLGRQLYQKLEDRAKELGCETVEVIAVSKDYKKLLHLYIEELGLEFFNAHLMKKL